MGTAYEIHPTDRSVWDGMNGSKRLFRLDPPLRQRDWFADDEDTFTEHEIVVVSAAAVTYSGPETYIFPADRSGEITSFGELEGSFRGALDHEEALRNAGYDRIEDEVVIDVDAVDQKALDA